MRWFIEELDRPHRLDFDPLRAQRIRGKHYRLVKIAGASVGASRRHDICSAISRIFPGDFPARVCGPVFRAAPSTIYRIILRYGIQFGEAINRKISRRGQELDFRRRILRHVSRSWWRRSGPATLGGKPAVSRSARVTGGVYEPATMLLDERVNDLAIGGKRIQRRLLVLPHEAAVAVHVGAEYRG